MFNKNLKNIKPYVTSDRFTNQKSKMKILLDWNESTTIFSKDFEKEISQTFEKIDLNLYGDVDCKNLRNKISRFTSLHSDQISVFNGSDSALNIVFESVIEHGDNVLKYEPEYSQVDTFIHMKGGQIFRVQSKNVFENEIELLEEVIRNNKIKIVYFSNPNNPSGTKYTSREIEKLVSNNKDTCFLIDEAYVEFCGDSASILINKYKNIIIFRTFSKAFGLAGLRVGYIISCEDNIKQINKIRNGKEVNSVSQVIACKALDYSDDLAMHIKKINNIKRTYFKKFSKIKGMKVINTFANFLIIKHKNNDQVVDYLSSKNILIRNRGNFTGMKNCSRITIGTEDEMEKLYTNLKAFLRNV